jgi:hypothetical protein
MNFLRFDKHNPKKLTIIAAMRRWMESGHYFAHDAVKIEVDRDDPLKYAWVIDNETREPIQLFSSAARAKAAIDRAARKGGWF